MESSIENLLNREEKLFLLPPCQSQQRGTEEGVQKPTADKLSHWEICGDRGADGADAWEGFAFGHVSFSLAGSK